MQLKYFSQYLSSAPVLATITLSAIAVLLILINYNFPDILFFSTP